MLAEFVVPEPFPRIQLEGALNPLVVEVHEMIFAVMPADIVNENGFGFQTGLFTGVAQIQNGHLIFGEFLDATEMNCGSGGSLRSGQALPSLNEPLVD